MAQRHRQPQARGAATIGVAVVGSEGERDSEREPEPHAEANAVKPARAMPLGQ